MKEQALLLIHGMGKNSPPGKDGQGKLTPGSFGKEFIDASTQALQYYPGHKADTLEKHVDIHEFNYDVWFDKMRMEMADRAKGMNDRLKAVTAIYGVSFAADLAGKLWSFEKDFGDDDFFHTHWLDVIFYSTMLGAKVRVDLAVKIAELLKNYGQSNVHIMAYSLGSVVLHDTLHLLYRPESDPENEIPDLHLTEHKLASIWMVSNVSRLINTLTRLSDPYTSIVKPGDNGCTNNFYNIRHELDPLTWLSCFNPDNDGSWVPETIYSTSYTNIVTNLVADGNTHDFMQYIQNPTVAVHLFSQLIHPFTATLQDMNMVAQKYSEKTINGAYAALKESFHGLDKKDITSWRQFFEAANALLTAAKGLKESLA